jgi:heme A synthase
MTSTTTTSAPTRGLRLFTPLAGVTSLGIFLQAVTAGEFVSQKDRDGWIAVHDIIADVTMVAAIATAIVGLLVVRKVSQSVAWGSVALFVLLILQTVIGHLITDAHQDGWIGVHVPLALVVFAMTIWLSIRGTALRRAGR